MFSTISLLLVLWSFTQTVIASNNAIMKGETFAVPLPNAYTKSFHIIFSVPKYITYAKSNTQSGSTFMKFIDQILDSTTHRKVQQNLKTQFKVGATFSSLQLAQNRECHMYPLTDVVKNRYTTLTPNTLLETTLNEPYDNPMRSFWWCLFQKNFVDWNVAKNKNEERILFLFLQNNAKFRIDTDESNGGHIPFKFSDHTTFIIKQQMKVVYVYQHDTDEVRTLLWTLRSPNVVGIQAIGDPDIIITKGIAALDYQEKQNTFVMDWIYDGIILEKFKNIKTSNTVYITWIRDKTIFPPALVHFREITIQHNLLQAYAYFFQRLVKNLHFSLIEVYNDKNVYKTTQTPFDNTGIQFAQTFKSSKLEIKTTSLLDPGRPYLHAINALKQLDKKAKCKDTGCPLNVVKFVISEADFFPGTPEYSIYETYAEKQKFYTYFIVNDVPNTNKNRKYLPPNLFSVKILKCQKNDYTCLVDAHHIMSEIGQILVRLNK